MESRPSDMESRTSTETGRSRRWAVRLSGVLAVSAASLGLAACSSSPSTSSSGSATTSGSSAPIVSTANNSKYGTILVDNQGKTLYTVTSGGAPVPCTGSCGHTWPPLLVPVGSSTLKGGPGVSDLAKSASGTVVEYMGYPLFRYSGDTATGEANGNGISSNGGTWYVIKPGTKPGTPITSG
jgi:predicted lipoprotein with Yx(FWY)xxD motif